LTCELQRHIGFLLEEKGLANKTDYSSARDNWTSEKPRRDEEAAVFGLRPLPLSGSGSLLLLEQLRSKDVCLRRLCLKTLGFLKRSSVFGFLL
jgi:hypothetical protein